MKQPFALFITAALPFAVFAAEEAPQIKINLPSENTAPAQAAAPAIDEKTPTALAPQPVSFSQADLMESWGWMIAQRMQIGMLGFTAEELDGLTKGLKNGALGGKPPHDIKQIGPQLQQLISERYMHAQNTAAEANAKANERFFENLKKDRPTVVSLPSGLCYEILKEGDGPKPRADQIVKVHYTGALIDGRVFDSSVRRGEPVEFPLDGVIPGWIEGLQQLKQGTKAMLFIPPQLGYGEAGAGDDIPPNATLVFEVELLEVRDKPKPVEVTTPPVSAP